jgi:hypothetical protein
MHDGRWILLDFESRSSLKRIVDEYGDRIAYVARHANVQVGVSAVLVRPDGYVVWASDHQPPHESILRATASWFARGA